MCRVVYTGSVFSVDITLASVRCSRYGEAIMDTGKFAVNTFDPASREKLDIQPEYDPNNPWRNLVKTTEAIKKNQRSAGL